MQNIQIILDELQIPMSEVIRATIFLKVKLNLFRILMILLKLMQFMEVILPLKIIPQDPLLLWPHFLKVH